MDFTTVLSIAQKNDKHSTKTKCGFKVDLSAPRREKQDKSKSDKPRSEAVQKLIDEKEHEKEKANRERKMRQKQKEETKKIEEKSKRFSIPKKKEKIQNLLKDLDSDSDEGSNDSTSQNAGSHGNQQHHSNERKSEHRHEEYKSSKHKSDHSENKKHKNQSNGKTDAQSEKVEKSRSHRSNHSNHSSSKNDAHKASNSQSKHTSSSKDTKERDKQKSSGSNKHSNSSSSSNKHSSGSSSKDKSSNSSSQGKKVGTSSSSVSGKKSSKDLSLDELRRQVLEMKEQENEIAREEELERKRQEDLTHGIDFQKNRQGVEIDVVEERKAKIMSRTQMILERTKARLAEEKQGERQQRQRGSRRTNDKERLTAKEGDKIKSRCVVKDDDDSDDDEADMVELSSNQELMRTESGDILKNIKKKIDEQLGNYNFPDKPLKERRLRKQLNSEALRRSKDRSSLQRHNDRHKERLKEKVKDKHKNKFKDKHKAKRDNIKEMMRTDYQSSFSNGRGGDEQQQKVRKPVLVRRFQNQAPPTLNFNDLLKIAEKKCQEKLPEPKFKKPPKKVQERPQTQEELDRRKRAEDVKRRRNEEETVYNDRTLQEQGSKKGCSDKISAMKSKSDSSILKGALTGKNSPNLKPSQTGAKQMNPKERKGGKSDVVNNNVLVCRPSSSSGSASRPPEKEALNPWDRIYGQIQKNNPRPEKRKRQVLESSEEEDDEYDEDDDFIDKDDGGVDYSAEIRNMFGYDKRKYRFEDDDDVDNMEANYATIMKEEARSAKIGKMEDLEDIRREEEELRREKLAKKSRKRY